MLWITRDTSDIGCSKLFSFLLSSISIFTYCLEPGQHFRRVKYHTFQICRNVCCLCSSVKETLWLKFLLSFHKYSLFLPYSFSLLKLWFSIVVFLWGHFFNRQAGITRIVSTSCGFGGFKAHGGIIMLHEKENAKHMAALKKILLQKKCFGR